LADPNDADHDGISGRIQTVMIHRQASSASGALTTKAEALLSHQVAGALNNDMGVTTSVFPVLDGETTNGTPDSPQ